MGKSATLLACIAVSTALGSIQPTVDKKQIRRSDFRLAMRPGKSNHYKVNEIQARHFMETGLEGGLSRSSILSILEEVGGQADRVIHDVFDVLPDEFPAQLIDSLSDAVKRRAVRLSM